MVNEIIAFFDKLQSTLLHGKSRSGFFLNFTKIDWTVFLVIHMLELVSHEVKLVKFPNPDF